MRRGLLHLVHEGPEIGDVRCVHADLARGHADPEFAARRHLAHRVQGEGGSVLGGGASPPLALEPGEMSRAAIEASEGLDGLGAQRASGGEAFDALAVEIEIALVAGTQHHDVAERRVAHEGEGEAVCDVLGVAVDVWAGQGLEQVLDGDGGRARVWVELAGDGAMVEAWSGPAVGACRAGQGDGDGREAAPAAGLEPWGRHLATIAEGTRRASVRAGARKLGRLPLVEA